MTDENNQPDFSKFTAEDWKKYGQEQKDSPTSPDGSAGRQSAIVEIRAGT